MDSEGFMHTFQDELKCSICMNYFIDPVTTDCGHSFCRPCLYLCWEEEQAPKSCPECRAVSEKPDFKTNIVLKRLASLARQARASHSSSSEEQLCGTHREAKGLFCEADKTLLCGPCSEGPEHAAHSHSPIQWAAEERREMLLKRMDSLWKMTQEMQNNRNQETKKIRSLEVRKSMLYFLYGDGYNSSLTFSEIQVST
uniref:Uncharacterized protein n=1 Tax=Sus scrofa TaxID=9823 RepID=A0A8D0NP63_PIG